MQFFLDKLAARRRTVFLHLELVPDHLPEALKALDRAISRRARCSSKSASRRSTREVQALV